MMRIRVGLALTFGLFLMAVAPSATGAASGHAVPLAGDWEGTGPHGAPLSFKLLRQSGHLVATSLAVGYPESCPAIARDAEAVPLANVAYSGPGGRTSPGSTALPPVALSGQVPHSTQVVLVRGGFSSPSSGTLSVQLQKKIGCGWPDTTLNWSVHRAARRAVADGTWTGPLTAHGLINGNVRFIVGEQGRVIDSFTSFFTCITDTQQGNTNFRSSPAFDFIRPDGSFYSPLTSALLRGHRTTWSGRFLNRGKLSGTVTIFNDCTNHLIKVHFDAKRTKP
jgi:hypothetical protein